MAATRTLNPLHFEDLEPHRFEDLVRQLAYEFRTWRSIEATGRKGKDEGVDIRAFEIVLDATAVDEDGGAVAVAHDREWRIQVKRHKELGAKDLERIVDDAVPDPAMAPYGLIVAAACDVSAATLSAFRTSAAGRGVREFLLWTTAHLEDLLFLPRNDHLLFAYFGISLQTKVRSQLIAVRATITVKRKLRSALRLDTEGHHQKWVLIRDVDDSDYPNPTVAQEHVRDRAAPWHAAELLTFYGRGLLVERFSYAGSVEEDGSWDYDPETRSAVPQFGREYWKEVDPEARNRIDVQYNDPVRKIIREFAFLPYENILEVDPFGDALNDAPHVFCRFSGPDGPYDMTAISGFGYYPPMSRSLHPLNPSKLKDAGPAPAETVTASDEVPAKRRSRARRAP